MEPKVTPMPAIQEPNVMISVSQGQLNVQSTFGDALQTVQFLLGTVSALLQTIKASQPEKNRIVLPQLTIPNIRGESND